jgi:hypothetical protein
LHVPEQRNTLKLSVHFAGDFHPAGPALSLK